MSQATDASPFLISVLRPLFARAGDGALPDEAGQVLEKAERGGFRLLLVGRSLLLATIFFWQFYYFTIHGNPTGCLLALASFAAGLLVFLALGTSFERRWHRYALFALDIGALTLVACLAPLVEGEPVPKILIFRAYGTSLLFLLLAVTALSLMPGLVLFTGAALTLGLWILIAVIAGEQEQLRSWGELGPDTDAATYLELVQSVDFINWAIRLQESFVLLGSAVVLALAVGRARRAVLAFAEAEQRRHRAEEVFGHFVPRDVAAEILAEPDALKPRVQEATVLYLDIEGFTAFSEGRQPPAVMAALDGFFSDAAAIVSDHGGTALSYAGDAMLATFGLPRGRERPAVDAIAAAKALQDASATTSYDGQLFKLRIGLASGPLAAGNIGGSQRSYTVYGDTVNMAQRLEDANKQCGTGVLACQATWKAAGAPGDFRSVGEIAVKGRQVPIEAYCWEPSS